MRHRNLILWIVACDLLAALCGAIIAIHSGMKWDLPTAFLGLLCMFWCAGSAFVWAKKPA